MKRCRWHRRRRFRRSVWIFELGVTACETGFIARFAEHDTHHVLELAAVQCSRGCVVVLANKFLHLGSREVEAELVKCMTDLLRSKLPGTVFIEPLKHAADLRRELRTPASAYSQCSLLLTYSARGALWQGQCFQTLWRGTFTNRLRKT